MVHHAHARGVSEEIAVMPRLIAAVGAICLIAVVE
jgi:hypothetical protein